VKRFLITLLLAPLTAMHAADTATRNASSAPFFPTQHNAMKHLLSLLLFPFVTLALSAADLSSSGPFKVTVIEFQALTDAQRENRKAPIKVHLPEGRELCPTVVISHGAGGDWDTHFAQAQHLASHGYAVLCLEHVGSNLERMKQGMRFMKNLNEMIRDSSEVLGRPKDVSFALDCAAEWNRSHAKLRGRLDLQHAGVMGHSFGAFTTMVVCGMRPALDWITPRVEPGKGLGPDLQDRRVKCGVALSPQGADEPFFIRASFASLKVPLLGISGTEDRQQGGLPATNRRDAFKLWPEGAHRFVWLTNARHLDFTDSTGSSRHAMSSPTREDVQPIVRAATLLFFNANLKADSESAKRLTGDVLKPYLHGAVNHVEVLSK
jgi:predicted dienelactone hydrolase